MVYMSDVSLNPYALNSITPISRPILPILPSRIPSSDFSFSDSSDSASHAKVTSASKMALSPRPSQALLPFPPQSFPPFPSQFFPPLPSRLPAYATQEMLRQYLNQWASRDDGDAERVLICQTIMRFLLASSSKLLLNATELTTELPDIFNVEILVKRIECLWISFQGSRLPSSVYCLKNLRSLQLQKCDHVIQISDSICKLNHLEYLSITGCRELTDLPESIAELPWLKSLTLGDNPQMKVPMSLYRLALERPEVALRHPEINEAAKWMQGALEGRHQPYQLEVFEEDEIFDEEVQLGIKVRRDTMIPFAQQHLQLCLEAIGTQDSNCVDWVPFRSRVRYLRSDGREEIGGDAGGVSREYWFQLLPNIAKQTQAHHPILKESGEGQYILEKEMGRVMTEQDIALCENIGKLLSLFASGLGEDVTLGNVFPEHYFSAIVYIYYRYFWSYSKNAALLTFQTMSTIDKNAICCLLAMANKEGIKDRKGNLLFEMSEKRHIGINKKINYIDISLVNVFSINLRKFVFTNETLYKIWTILNLQVNEEEIKAIFPLLSGFVHAIEEMPLQGEELENFATVFIIYLMEQKPGGDYLSDFVARAVIQYAYDTYSRQAEPLVFVARGFRNVVISKIQPVINAYHFGLRPVGTSKYGKKLSEMIQGASFTREAFLAWMDRSVNIAKGSQQQAVKEKMLWLKEWYRTQATQQQMKEFVRCITGAEGITSQYVEFDSPQGSWSVFHTCFVSVNLGTQLLQEKNKEAFIDLWKKNVHFALHQAGFNVI